VVFCQVGLRGYLAQKILKQHGFANVKNLSGGYKTYSYAVDKQENPDIFDYEQIKPIEEKEETGSAKTLKLNACGLQCPGPILETFKKMQAMEEGDVLEITATDPGFKKDIGKWAEKTGNKLLNVTAEGKNIVAMVKKGRATKEKEVSCNVAKDNKTIVVFSSDLDKVLASFVIANGALAMGKQVTLFFTFWGLNVLRKEAYVPVKKNIVEKMFGIMMPRGSKKLKLSKMNFGGAGTAMMKEVMKAKSIDSLEAMIKTAVENGVKLIACQMSMDMMGIKAEELIDGVEIGGVATYLSEAEDSNMNLFI
jgi:peroxiredoxin family protein/TusA-related sulfurtransferase